MFKFLKDKAIAQYEQYYFNYVIKKLNDLLKVDNDFAQKMFKTYHKVNDNFIDNSSFVADAASREAGIVGILNGILPGSDKYRVCVISDSNSGNVIEFVLYNVRGK
jgi:hypothetical protein